MKDITGMDSDHSIEDLQNHSGKRRAVVLINLGGPHDQAGVGEFLFRLFNDPFILPYGRFLRYGLARMLSLLRTRKAQAIYQAMNCGGGSPLYINTQAQAKALSDVLQTPTFVAMRYAPPYIEDVVEEVYQSKPDEIILLPLYPQYSMTTTQSALQTWFKAALGKPHIPTQWVSYFYDHPLFIRAYAELITPILAKAKAYGEPRIVLSAHGLPVELVEKGDPYPEQVHAGAKALSQFLNQDVFVSYQSRVGPKRWLDPSTESMIHETGALGLPLVVVPFAFVSEHSETLYELDTEYRHIAEQAGVPYYGRVPALGTNATFIKCLAQLVET